MTAIVSHHTCKDDFAEGEGTVNAGTPQREGLARLLLPPPPPTFVQKNK